MTEHLCGEKVRDILDALYDQTLASIIKDFSYAFRQLQQQAPEEASKLEKDFKQVLEKVIEQLNNNWKQFEDYAINNVFYSPQEGHNTLSIGSMEVQDSPLEDDIPMQQLDDEILTLRQQIAQERRLQQQKAALTEDLKSEVERYGDLHDFRQVVAEQEELQKSQEEVFKQCSDVRNMLDNVQNLLIQTEAASSRTDNCRQAYSELREKFPFDLDTEQLSLYDELINILEGGN
eukprot:TRINITY_DN6873_c0_g1_i4.p1 TRINITY_DN6873_c0_g1~~TRINITY_DN6873_c0_g1_i4.p1  ORF type:complete len:233 (+),score=32.56 TRINITY_DN6873_c0_g1_i4:97-795(+)